MGQRHKAREYALQALYMHDVGKRPLDEITDFEWLDTPIDDESREFSLFLIEGVIANIEKIDAVIKQRSKNWTPERLAVIDRAILRLAVFEMLFMDDIPDVVTIDESIELGKTFGGENSGQFINGILDSVKKFKLREA
jgi:N utilization substance protein B